MTHPPRWSRPVLLVMALLTLGLVALGCEPADGHDHDHGNGHHDHGHEGHDHHGHAHDANDPDVLDIAIIGPAAGEPEGLPSVAEVESAGGHVTWRGGQASPDAIAAALGEVSRYCDAVVIETPTDAADREALEVAIREAGLRGVRVVVVGRGLGEPGVDYLTAVVPAEGASPGRRALLDAAIDAAHQAASTDAGTVPGVIEVDLP